MVRGPGDARELLREDVQLDARGAYEACAMKVAVLRDVPDERRLSMERFADEMVAALQRADVVQPVALTVGARRSTSSSRRVRNVYARAARFGEYPLRAAVAARRWDADVFHIIDHSYGDLAAVLPKDRTVVTCHDLMLLRAEEGAAGARSRRSTVGRFRWSTSFLRRVAHVACDSECTRADVIRLCRVDPARTSVIPLGVRPVFAPLDDVAIERLRAGLPMRARWRLLHVSSGLGYKNAATTIRVLAALRRGGADVSLIRAGGTLGAAEVELCAALGVEDVLTDFGHVSDERLVELYNACDVLLFPSFYEGFGLPVLEAMACGTPVVASNTPALVELAGGVALVADPLDVDMHVANVQAVLSRPIDAAHMRERGLARAATYTWERAAVQYSQLYRAVLDAR